ncbi:MAG: cytochrome c peroxidase, partial [Ferruginibacter sp.]
MNYRLYLIALFVCSGIILSFIIEPESSDAERVQADYLQNAREFHRQVSVLKNTLASANKNQIQQQFILTRSAYKKIEIFVEYFFPFYAGKLNGPPIPFFEESEPDMGEQQPMGMQLIESYIFPNILLSKKNDLLFQVKELDRYANELPEVNSSFAFDDSNTWDAIMEELYRVTATGITGFDSQVAANSLAENREVLKGMQTIISFYKKSFKDQGLDYEQFDNLLTKAEEYLSINTNFNDLDREVFIRSYLNPITKMVALYKTSKGYIDNPSSRFYSAIRKNNTLFARVAFNPYRFLDDYNSNAYKVFLGKKLFFDNRLSSGNNRSCASCHNPSLAFTDGLAKSKAIDGHTILPRNAPTIWNAALQRNLFYDSRSRTLEDQVMQVLNNANEMHGSADTSAKNILLLDEYKSLYTQAFPLAKSGDAAINICNAIASYERTLVSLNSKFDRHMRGEDILNKNEINGFNLFMGKAKCGTCHFMPLFSGAKPPRYYFIESEVIGVPASANKTKPTLDKDSGRFLITKQ